MQLTNECLMLVADQQNTTVGHNTTKLYTTVENPHVCSYCLYKKGVDLNDKRGVASGFSIYMCGSFSRANSHSVF